MKAYELVIVVDPAANQDEQATIQAIITDVVGDGIKQTDDMGLQQFPYAMQEKKHLTKGMMTAYYIQATPAQVQEVKTQLGYKKTVIRCVVFAITADQPFMTLADVQKGTQALVEDEAWTLKKRITFFDEPVNTKYISRKAQDLLKKFTTRFGDIKPSKYTGLAVKNQKKIRKAIIRSRELGFLPFIK